MKEKRNVAVALLFPRDVHSSSIFLDLHYLVKPPVLPSLPVLSRLSQYVQPSKYKKVGFSITFCAGFLKYFI